MEMVTARPGNVNAWIIMNMHKIAHIMDVSIYNKTLCFFLQSVPKFQNIYLHIVPVPN